MKWEEDSEKGLKINELKFLVRLKNYWSWSAKGTELERKKAVDRWMFGTEFMKRWYLLVMIRSRLNMEGSD